MKKRRLLLAAALTVLFTSAAGAQKMPHPARPPLAQNIAGIRVGPHASKDADVTKAYGPGLFTDQEGHGGGRYFTDPSRSITLHIEIGVDRVIDHVELTRGISLPKELNASAPAFVAKGLPAAPVIDKGLKLGMSGSEIIKTLGRPQKDKKSGAQRTIIYEATEDKDPRVRLYYEAEFTLVGDRLKKISLYDGE